MGALLGRAHQTQIDRSQLLCRLFDSLVGSVIAYVQLPAMCLARVFKLANHWIGKKALGLPCTWISCAP